MNARKCHPKVDRGEIWWWAVCRSCQEGYIENFDSWAEAMDSALQHRWECWA